MFLGGVEVEFGVFFDFVFKGDICFGIVFFFFFYENEWVLMDCY